MSRNIKDALEQIISTDNRKFLLINLDKDFTCPYSINPMSKTFDEFTINECSLCSNPQVSCKGLGYKNSSALIPGRLDLYRGSSEGYQQKSVGLIDNNYFIFHSSVDNKISVGDLIVEGEFELLSGQLTYKIKSLTNVYSVVNSVVPFSDADTLIQSILQKVTANTDKYKKNLIDYNSIVTFYPI